jgi:hypothetical protein
LVTSSLIRETTENESANEGYRFGQEEEKFLRRTQILLRNGCARGDEASPQARFYPVPR